MSFTKGLKKKLKVDASQCSDAGQMYPSPNTSTNVSGSDKYAAFNAPKPAGPYKPAPMPAPTPTPKPLTGVGGGARPVSQPARIDRQTTKSITGVSQSITKRHAFGGGKPLSLKSMSALKKGL